MDTERFDHLSRVLSVGVPRRSVIAGLTGGLLAALPLTLSIETAQAKKRKKGKSKKKKTQRNEEHNKQGKDENQNSTPQTPDSAPPDDAPPPPPPPPPTPPPPVVNEDAVCTGPIAGAYGSPDGNSRYAQTFTVVASGPLVSARLIITKQTGTAGDYLLHLNTVDGSGYPTDTVLAAATVSDPGVADGQSKVTFAFAQPAPVVAGAQYALVLSRPGSDHVAWVFRDGNGCDGRSFHSVAQTGGFGPLGGNRDFLFTTVVSP